MKSFVRELDMSACSCSTFAQPNVQWFLSMSSLSRMKAMLHKSANR